MNATVYYLTWDETEERDEEYWRKENIRRGQKAPVDLESYREVLTLEDVDGLADAWRRLNRRTPGGYDRRLDKLEERSMCKGDLIVTGDGAYLARGIGFEKLDLKTA